MKNFIFQSRDLCLRALDTNSLCAKNVRRNVEKYEMVNKRLPGRTPDSLFGKIWFQLLFSAAYSE